MKQNVTIRRETIQEILLALILHITFSALIY